MKCCYEFCDLKEPQAQDNVVELNCGHKACPMIGVVGNICSICAIKRLLKEFKRYFNIETIEYPEKRRNKETSFPLTDDEDEEDKSEETPNIETKTSENRDYRTHQAFENASIIKQVLNESLPGFEGEATIELKMFIPDGIQNVRLSNPKTIFLLDKLF